MDRDRGINFWDITFFPEGNTNSYCEIEEDKPYKSSVTLNTGRRHDRPGINLHFKTIQELTNFKNSLIASYNLEIKKYMERSKKK